MTKRILDCSDELLLKIFAYLATKRPAGHCKHCNYYQLSRTCSRFHQVALPLLYHGIQFMTKDGLQRSKGYPVLPSLELLIRVINTHPERAGWIHYAKFGWLEQSIATWHAIFDVCARLLALRTLSLRVYWDIPWSLREGLRICEKVTFAKLGRLPTLSCTSINVEDPRITTEDVASFCALPKLEHFKVIRLCKETTTTAIPAADIDSCVTPVRRLEFFKCTDMPKEQTLQGFFKKHSSLRELTWKVEHMDSPGWDPSDTLTNLLPLCSTLVKLRLSIGKGCGCNAYTGVGRIMDFTQFTALKVLEVHGLILFPRQFRIRRFSTEWAAPYNFPEKLPESLEELQIILNEDTGEFGPFFANQSNHDWIISLAEHKLSYIKQLFRVTVMERKRAYGSGLDSDSDREIEKEVAPQEDSNEVSNGDNQTVPTHGAVGDLLESSEEESGGYKRYNEDRDRNKIVWAWMRQKTELRDAFHGVGIELRLVIRGYRHWGKQISMRRGREETKVQKEMSILMNSLSD